jgi:hypothetical protein
MSKQANDQGLQLEALAIGNDAATYAGSGLLRTHTRLDPELQGQK